MARIALLAAGLAALLALAAPWAQRASFARTRRPRLATRARRAALAVMAPLLLCSVSGIAATIQVPADYATVGAAIAAAAPGDTVEVAVGTLAGTGDPVFINKDLTLRGAGAERTTLAGTGLVVGLSSACNVAIEDLTIERPWGPNGGIAAHSGSVTLTNVVLRGGLGGNCGGLFVLPAAKATVTRCTIENNMANGGRGGGARVWGILILTDCRIAGNRADYYGGGICLESTAVMEMTGCRITGNLSGCGAGVFANAAPIRATDCTIDHNRGGRGIYSSGVVQLQRSLVEDNCGGVESTDVVQLERTEVRGNIAAGNGGGVCAAVCYATECTFSDNVSLSGQGGGIYRSIGTVTGCTFTRNRAQAGGGAAGDGGFVSCTFDGNAASVGGGLYFFRGYRALLRNCTVVRNSATYAGGGVCGDGWAASVNTLYAGNPGGNWSVSVTQSLGHNLSDDSTGPFGGPGDMLNTDAKVGALEDNGGPTLTCALKAGSPAIDAGLNDGAPAMDQRAVVCPQDGDADGTATCDIGAYEYVNLPPVAQDLLISTSEDTSVPATLSAADPDGDSVTYVLLTYPAHGVLSGAPPSLKYTPDPNYHGSDTFEYAPVGGVIQGGAATAAIVVAPVNDAPELDSVAGTTEPVAVGTSVSLGATFTDPDLADTPPDTHKATWDWADGSTSTVDPAASPVPGMHTYTAPGVYTVKATVTDSGGLSAEGTYRYVVVYDPSGGFVTGGGWIDSPAGAYAANPSLTGKATFGFNAKYHAGATVPDGQAEFQFRVADLNFHSSAYEWLVVAGPKAQFRGVGTINGTGEYRFFITAIDGQRPGGGGTDRFRIRIWDKTTGGLVYDNQLGAADDADPTTALGGGSIVIHE